MQLEFYILETSLQTSLQNLSEETVIVLMSPLYSSAYTQWSHFDQRSCSGKNNFLMKGKRTHVIELQRCPGSQSFDAFCWNTWLILSFKGQSVHRWDSILSQYELRIQVVEKPNHETLCRTQDTVGFSSFSTSLMLHGITKYFCLWQFFFKPVYFLVYFYKLSLIDSMIFFYYLCL